MKNHHTPRASANRHPAPWRLKPLTDRVASVTLTEMLVVVAVIVILLALLMPSLKGARAQAKVAACANNLRQIYTAMDLYAKDNNDRFVWPIYFWLDLGYGQNYGSYSYTQDQANRGYCGPGEPTYDTFGAGTGTYRWPIFHCPADAGYWVTGVFTGPDPHWLENGNWDNDYLHCSYNFNWSISGYYYYAPYMGPPSNTRKGFSGGTRLDNYTYDVLGNALELPKTRGRALIVAEGYKVDTPAWDWCPFMWTQDMGYGYYAPGQPGWDAATYTNMSHAYRHPGNRMNGLFLDGHVESLQRAKYSKSSNYMNIWRDYPHQ